MGALTPAFKVLEITATGTYGTVCVAEDLRYGRLVALKVLKGEHLERPRIVARARDEARMMFELRHPNIVEVHELVNVCGRPVVVMEWVRGPSLSRLLRAHPRGVPAAMALHLLHQACSALHAAYEAVPASGGPPMRVIHRDIKPSNLLVSFDGTLKLVDFGIAKAELDHRESITLSMVLGARDYLAPERLDGDDDAPSVDVYALGVVMYELLCGEHVEMSLHPRLHAEALATALRFLRLPDVEPRAAGAIRRLIERMCSYSPSERPSHIEAAAQAQALLQAVGGPDAVRQWANRHLWPQFLQRPTRPPPGHKAWADLAFLDEHAQSTPRACPPDVDHQLRELLGQADWSSRPEALSRLTLLNPHWSPAPLLEHLERSSSSWWRPWSSTKPATELISLLELLRPHAGDPSVMQTATALLTHQDAAVAGAARAIVDQTTS